MEDGNEVSRSKSCVRAKLKADSQEEWIHLWKQHFENLLGKPQKLKHEPITKIINNQLGIKLGQFPQEELDSVLRKIKNRKAAELDPQDQGIRRHSFDPVTPYITKTQ